MDYTNQLEDYGKMKIEKIKINEINKKSESCAMCIGYFDGLHIGHMALVKKTIEIGNQYHLKKALFTFNPNPSVFLKKSLENHVILPLNERAVILEDEGIDFMYIIEFTLEVAQLSPNEFINKIILPLNVKQIICGFDFRFGEKGAGTGNTLQLLSNQMFGVTIINEVDDSNHQKISTTNISAFIENGKMESAFQTLGRHYFIKGVVQHGKKNGSKIGFPTANILILENYIRPKIGVYAVKILFEGKEYLGMANYGLHPSIDALNQELLEVHIYDFHQKIYGKEIKVNFVKYIREEIKFNNIENLKKQLIIDKILINNLLNQKT